MEAFSSTVHGKGLRATRSFKRGDIIFLEVPHLFLQSTPNKQDALVCANCACFVGSVGTQLGLLEGTLTRQELLNDNPLFAGDVQLTPIVHCQDHCGEVYCSDECRDYHHRRGHALLCTGRITEEEADTHPLVLFKQHAVSTNEIFLLVGQMFSFIVSAVDRIPTEQREQLIDYIISPYENFIRELWWDVARNPTVKDLEMAHLSGQALEHAKQKMQESDAMAQALLQQSLKKIIHESYTLMCELFSLGEKGLTHRLSEEYVARTIGMFEQNNVGVRLENPLIAFMRALTADSPALMHIVLAVERISSRLEENTEDDDMQEAWDESDENDDSDEQNESAMEQFCQPCEVASPNSPLDRLHAVMMEHDEDTLFPPLDGTSFYTAISLMNHSCEPNMLVEYTTLAGNNSSVGGPFEDMLTEFRGSIRKGLCAQVRVLKDVSPGDELFQSYIDVNLDVEGRQESLRDYGINCQCGRCIRELQEEN